MHPLIHRAEKKEEKKIRERKRKKKENSLRRFLMHAEPRTRSTLPSPRVALCHPPPLLPPIPIYRTFNNAGIRKIPAHGTLRLEFLMKIFSLFLQSWPRLHGPRFFPLPLSLDNRYRGWTFMEKY